MDSQDHLLLLEASRSGKESSFHTEMMEKGEKKNVCKGKFIQQNLISKNITKLPEKHYEQISYSIGSISNYCVSLAAC